MPEAADEFQRNDLSGSWVKLHRGLYTSNVYRMGPPYRDIWLWLISHACFKDYELKLRNGETIQLKLGQLATSYRAIAQGVSWGVGFKTTSPSLKTIKKALDWLESEQMIEISFNRKHKFSVITIRNYEAYQSYEATTETVRNTTRKRCGIQRGIQRGEQEEVPEVLDVPRKHILSDSVEPDRVVGAQDSPDEKPKAPGLKYTPGFLRWWKAYPPYRKDAKPKAFAIWKRRGLEERTEEQLELLEERRAYLCRENGEYCPMPTTYLGQGRDEGEAHIAWMQSGGDAGPQEPVPSYYEEITPEMMDAMDERDRIAMESWEKQAEAHADEEVPL
ncbi:MAG: hypothetical protein HYY96_08495 [Candidatus Tectomicrobia bacterium]|nr:hypothetical protein [Candidatus Tectomicrobia bacterium]